MNNTLVSAVVGGIIGLVLGTVLVGTVFPGARYGSVGMMGNTPNALGTPVMGGIDRHFIEQMVPHHEGAIAMATVAVTRAVRPEIKTLAGAIIKDQSKEIEDMSAWYKDWFRTEVPDTSTFLMEGGMMSVSGMHMGGQEDIGTLENAADFDKAFIEAMIPHHQLAVMMAQMLRSGTTRPEMLSLADAIIESQSREIQDMRDWYVSWYK